MKRLFALLLALTCLAVGAQQVPLPASNYASSPISRITAPDGRVVTIVPANTTAGARPTNSPGGVFSMPPSTAFWINYAATMTPYTGWNTIRITSSVDSGTAGRHTTEDGHGDFRTDCFASHMDRFDSIVAPGVNLYGHMHTVFGNASVFGATDPKTLANLSSFGTSTCAGGIANRTAYWVPSVIDTTNGVPQVPLLLRAYYKNDSIYRAAHPRAVVAPPDGLRFISGNPSATADQTDIVTWTCEANMSAGTQHHIPTAAELAANPTWCSGADDVLTMDISFGACWDGVNLDSPGHKAHMARENDATGCPSDHPIVLPQFEYKVDYSVKKMGGRANIPNFRLSSDNYPLSQPGGISGHGDWYNGWKREVLETWVENCLRGSTDCHNDVIDRWDANPHRLLCAADALTC